MEHDHMAIPGIGGDEGRHIDERGREGRHEIGRTPSCATIVNVEDTTSLHGANDVAGVVILGKEASNRGNIWQVKLGGQVLRERSDLCAPGDLVEDAVCAAHRGNTKSVFGGGIKSGHANMGASSGRELEQRTPDMDVLGVREVEFMQPTILGRDDHMLEVVVGGEKAAQAVN